LSSPRHSDAAGSWEASAPPPRTIGRRLTEERGDEAAEALVNREVVDAADGGQVTFTEVGPVELKGVSGPLRLYTARHA
jgi:hypothetical protein